MPNGQLIPAAECAPPSLRGLEPDDRMRVWASLVEEGDAALVASFRERAGSDAGAKVSMAEWLDREAERHTATALRMLRRTASVRRHHGE